MGAHGEGLRGWREWCDGDVILQFVFFATSLAI